MNNIEQRIAELALNVPTPMAPVANYVPYVISGNLVFISGQVSVKADGTKISGSLGQGLTIETGKDAARACALNLIAQMKAACGGDLTRVKRIVKVGGFVATTSSLTALEIPQIINGCSDLFVEVFGDAGRHARFAVGSSSLPADCAVEIDAVVEISD